MAELDVVCVSCGETNPGRARFCLACGTALEQPEEERKLISALFVDLVGFTSRSDRADPEDVRDALRPYYACAKERIEQHGGVLEKFIGDGVTAVFGAPVAHGDDAERAVRAGLRVLEGIKEVNAREGLELEGRAAVDTGEAVVALGGAHRAGEALATGDVVNTAARLQTAAPIGRLIVGAETYRATRRAVRYEPLPPVRAKGKAQPIEAWLAVEPIGAPAERRIADHRLVGRQRELELVEAIWQRALGEARPQRVTLLGPPGIGKSRLCHEASALVQGTGGRIVRGRCLPYDEQTGYQAFSQLVRAASGIYDTDSTEVAEEKLQTTVDRLLCDPEDSSTARHLAMLTALAPGARVKDKLLLFFAARRFLECLGREQPTLAVFEDIHWAAESELDLLDYLAAHLRESSIVLVTLARPELYDRRPTWGSGPGAQSTIPLEPLSSAESEQLVGELLESRDKATVARLLQVSEGNPLFIEELAAAIGERGDAEELPVTVRATIASRIDALPPSSRSTLLSAAVVGKTFWRGVLAAVADLEDVDEALQILEARDLVRREQASQLAGDVQFVFKHMLIREVAYGTVPRATRREQHASIARHVEGAMRRATDALAWVLAYHWREAGEGEKAIPYLLAAAEAARNAWAINECADLYSKAAELAADEDTRRQIRLRRGLALVAPLHYERATEELGELLPSLEGADRLDALLGMGHALVWTERDVETIATAEEALELAEKLGDREGVPAALALLSQGLAMRGEEGDLDRALELGDRALDDWVPGARRLDLTDHYVLHADTHYWFGNYSRCVEISRSAKELAGDINSPEALVRGGGTEALALAALGRHEEALQIWDELFVLAEELDWNHRGLLNYSSLAFRELLDLEEARRRSEHALELSPPGGFGMPRMFARSDLIQNELLAGDFGQAQETWSGLWEDAQHVAAWTNWLIRGRLLAARAEIALRTEGPEAAIEWASKSLEVALRTRRKKYEVVTRRLLGEALTALGRRKEATAELRNAVALADELVNPPARWQALAALARTLYTFGEDEGAEAAFNTAGELIRSFAETLAPPRAQHLLHAEPIREILSATPRAALSER